MFYPVRVAVRADLNMVHGECSGMEMPNTPILDVEKLRDAVFSVLSRPLLALSQEFLVVCLLSTCLRSLYVIVFPLEPTSLLLVLHLLVDEVLGPILFVDATRIPFCRALNHSSDLRECRYFSLPSVLLVVSMRIKDIAHLDKLEVPFE